MLCVMHHTGYQHKYVTGSLAPADSAVVMADGDCENLKQRTVNEDAVISMDMLKETHTATQDSIRDEKGELEMIKEQCVTDISTIGKVIKHTH